MDAIHSDGIGTWRPDYGTLCIPILRRERRPDGSELRLYRHRYGRDRLSDRPVTDAEPVAVSLSDADTDADTDADAEPVAECISDAVAEPVAECISDAVAEPVAG
jgi:hypothetical protein